MVDGESRRDGGPDRGFGAQLRRRRTAAGLSLADLAGLVHYSKSYLSRIETGAKPPGVDLARRCDAMLEAEGSLAALVREDEEPGTGAGPQSAADDGALWADDESQVWIMELSQGGASRFTPVGRRAAAPGPAGLPGDQSLLGLTVSPAAPLSRALAARTVPVDPFVVMFGQLRRLGQEASPAIVLPTVIAQAHALQGIAASARGGRQASLLLLAARYAEYAGWLAQESGDPRAALWWTDRAVEMAAAADDREMGANALIRRAVVALYRDDAMQTIELARLAQADRSISPRIRGLAALQEAQGHALAGDRSSCERTLEQGSVLLDAAARDDAAVLALGPMSTPDFAAVIRGWCYHDLGRPEAAADILDPELERLPEAARRSYARFGARLALCKAAAGDVDSACELAGQVVDAAVVVDSATVRVELGRLAHSLARWSARPEVQDVRRRLIQALQGAAV
jgi:transcriptional regulator with XRE-family HTH domain